MTASRQKVKLSSGPLTYMMFGEGRPLLYLHAAGGPQVSPFLTALSKTHRVYTPTAPGFEGTPVHNSVASIRALADLYVEFAGAIIKTPCDVMGHSFGGWTALWLAVNHPDTVGQMVLEAPEVASANAKTFGRYNNGILVDEDLLARLPEIKARTLIVMGSKDKMIPAEMGQVLKRKIPSSHLAYIYDAAHGVEVDQPERTLRLVKAFLERGESYIVNFADTAA